MKKLFLPILAILMIVSACVDDYTDANPPRRLDAPTVRVSSSGSTQTIVSTPVDRFTNASTAYIPYGETATFTVSVIDAPGKIGEVSVTPSVPEFGTVTLNESTVTSVQGQEQGDFTFTFTPNPALPDEEDRALNLVISVSDTQTDEDGEPNAKTTTFTLPANLVACITESLESGTYRVTAASGNLDGGAAYTLADLEAGFGGPIEVELDSEFPGRYEMDEVTGGVWPVFYSGRARPTFPVDLCGNTLVGHADATTAGTAPGPLRKFTVNGTVNGDGTVTVTWSYVRLDAATPANPAKGTYTLTKL